MTKEKQIDEMAKHCFFFEAGQCLTDIHISKTCDSECKECGLYQTLENLYNAGYRKSEDVAREIFEEIEKIRLRQIRKSEFFRNGSTEEMERKFYEGAEWGLRQLSHWFAELKKKYTEDGK